MYTPVVGVDACIGPEECTIFTKILGEFETSQRADVDIGPYRALCKSVLPHKTNQTGDFP